MLRGKTVARRQYGTGSICQSASDGRWVGAIQAGWTAKGSRRIITVSAKTRPEALRRLPEKQLQIATDGTHASGSGIVTVKTWSKKWLPIYQQSLRPTTYTTSNAGAIRKWIIPAIGHIRLSSLTPANIRVIDAIRAANVSSTTARSYHIILLGILKAAVAEGHHIPPRVLLVKTPAAAVNDRDAIPLPDARAILRAAADRPTVISLGAAGRRAMVMATGGVRRGVVFGGDNVATDIDIRVDLTAPTWGSGHPRPSSQSRPTTRRAVSGGSSTTPASRSTGGPRTGSPPTWPTKRQRQRSPSPTPPKDGCVSFTTWTTVQAATT